MGISTFERGFLHVAEAKEGLLYKPSISVVIPVLNRANELPRLFRSLMGQTYTGPVEVVVSDAGSTDGTVAVCRDARVNLVHAPENSGIGETRRVGCEAATGDIILNTDSDCSLSPKHLEAVVESFADPLTIASYGPVEYTYQGLPARGPVQQLLQKYMSRNLKVRHERGQPMLAGPNFAILKSVYEVLGGFDRRNRRIEEPVIYILLWGMPGKIVFAQNQKVQTELPWQKDSHPSIREFRKYMALNKPWHPIAVEIIKERLRDLPAMKNAVEEIIQARQEVMSR